MPELIIRRSNPLRYFLKTHFFLVLFARHSKRKYNSCHVGSLWEKKKTAQILLDQIVDLLRFLSFLFLVISVALVFHIFFFRQNTRLISILQPHIFRSTSQIVYREVLLCETQDSRNGKLSKIVKIIRQEWYLIFILF